MFCKNCGKEIPDNSRFCTGCGAQMAAAATAQQPDFGAASNTGSKPKKKIGGILGLVIVSLLVFLGAKSCGQAMAESYAKVRSEETTATTASTQSTTPVETVSVNPEYSQVFLDHSILFVPHVFFGLESNCYVYAEDGMVDHQQFGYKDDVVVEFIETVFVMTDGWTESEKEQYIEAIEDTFGNAGLDCATLGEINITDAYISFELVLKDMDNTANIRAAAEAEFITIENGYTLWGMSDSEEALLADGFIKR